MAGILYVVATPIGNLEDVTLRALRVLREVTLIAAEDTRRTARLLQHYSISTRTTSLHAHNEYEKAPKLIERLLAGDSVALVSDAGTPLISDPGQTLVAQARAANIRVESIPGASAVMAALTSSGFPTQEFSFVGFPPNRSKDRSRWFERIASSDRVMIFFEAPHRIIRTLEHLAELMGPETVVGVARELTKIHEELVIKPIIDIIKHFDDPRGEFTVIVPPICVQEQPAESLEKKDPEALRLELGEIAKNAGGGRRSAVKILAKRYGWSANELYKLIGSRS
jgi:16S rRNA (cytidine1402-2'-O)-methyltransferase